ncbi:MAG: DUF3459 domain-containing protein [Pseudomonadota bacterium]
MTKASSPPRQELVPRRTASGIRFTFEGGPDPEGVAVAGTFNSWVGDAAPLVRVGSSTWQATVAAHPGRHHYKKRKGRAWRYVGPRLHLAAAAVLLTLDGVPHLMMGQELNEPRWRDWMSLADDFQLDWDSVDSAAFKHDQALIALRKGHAALRQGDVHFVPRRARLLLYWRNGPQDRILVAVNLGGGTCGAGVSAS